MRHRIRLVSHGHPPARCLIPLSRYFATTWSAVSAWPAACLGTFSRRKDHEDRTLVPGTRPGAGAHPACAGGGQADRSARQRPGRGPGREQVRGRDAGRDPVARRRRPDGPAGRAREVRPQARPRGARRRAQPRDARPPGGRPGGPLAVPGPRDPLQSRRRPLCGQRRPRLHRRRVDRPRRNRRADRLRAGPGRRGPRIARPGPRRLRRPEGQGAGRLRSRHPHRRDRRRAGRHGARDQLRHPAGAGRRGGRPDLVGDRGDRLGDRRTRPPTGSRSSTSRWATRRRCPSASTHSTSRSAGPGTRG